MSVSNIINKNDHQKYFVEKLSPLFQLKTVQILLIREIHDYTILRTEEDRELNTVEIPKSLTNPNPELHVAFLGSKQKAAENRAYMAILRTINSELNNCVIPTDLCLKCPRCTLFGAVNTSETAYNIKHRVNYSTAFSLQPYEQINEIIQFNAVSEANQKTGQSLNVTHNVKPFALFPSVVSLNSVSFEEFILFIKTLIATKSYGAETRIKGTVKNRIYGISLGYEEIITSLEYTLEIRNRLSNQDVNNIDFAAITHEILEEYKKSAGMASDVKIMTIKDLDSFLEAVSNADVEETVKSCIDQSKVFVKEIKSAAGKS